MDKQEHVQAVRNVLYENSFFCVFDGFILQQEIWILVLTLITQPTILRFKIIGPLEIGSEFIPADVGSDCPEITVADMFPIKMGKCTPARIGDIGDHAGIL